MEWQDALKHKRILVPVDFSECSGYALEQAVNIGQEYGVEVVFLHCQVKMPKYLFHGKTSKENKQLAMEQREFIESEMEKYENITRQQDVRVSSRFITGGSVAKEILTFIESNDFDLVLMGTKGRTALEEVLIGSITQKVTRLSPVPVLSTRHTLQKENAEHLLVPIDFSNIAKEVVQYAALIAKRFSAKLTFIHVIEGKTHPYHPDREETWNEFNPELHAIIIGRMRDFVGDNIENQTFVLREGCAHREIADYADTHGCDLIVMGTCGQSAMDRLLMGSTTERVMALAPCPVLTIKKD